MAHRLCQEKKEYTIFRW